jgi:hypothetical protein
MPLEAMLEVEASNSSSSQYRYGIFKDFYSTADEKLKVVNAPPHREVKIIETLPNTTQLTSPQIQETTSSNTNNPLSAVGLIGNTIPSPSSNTIATPNVLEKGISDTHGVSNLDIGRYHFPLNAQLLVYNSTNSKVTSTVSNTSIYGGDVYSIKINK